MDFILDKLLELESLLKMQGSCQKEYLTMKEAAEYLQLSESFLYKLKGEEGLTYYKPGGKKIYFKKSDLDSWVEKGKVDCDFEIEQSIEDYISRPNKIYAA